MTEITTDQAPNYSAPRDESAPEIVERRHGRALDYALLLKPRVMSLVLFTGFAGMLLAPGHIDPVTGIIAVLAIALGAGASGAINMWYDRDIDGRMARTRNRPIPAGRLDPLPALVLGTVLSVISVGAMAAFVNELAAFLLALTITFYVFVYTIWLKRRTPQNIVIGGASGALPPMIGWAAVTGDIGLGAVVLFAIIFMWTPPHFWALSLYRCADYENAGVPMLPVVAGVEKTKQHILIYTLLLAPFTVAPALIGLSSWVAGILIGALSLAFVYHAVKILHDRSIRWAQRTFRFSIFYLFLIFVILLVDHGINALI